MAQTIGARKGIIIIGRQTGQTLVANVVMQIMVDRALGAVFDPVEISDLATDIGCSRADIIEACERLEFAGLFTQREPGSWQNLNALSPSRIGMEVIAVRGLPFDEANGKQMKIGEITIGRERSRILHGKEYTVDIEPQSADGEERFYFVISVDGIPSHNGTRETEDACWLAVQNYLPSENGPENVAAADKMAKKRSRKGPSK